MIVKEITLNKYKRMSNLLVDKITYKPNKRIQIIIGSNGMGKSSLLKELIPNAENLKNEYKENGYKKLVIKHRNSEYVITYTRDDNSYSITRDGVELNQSLNVKTFKTILEKEFNINKHIHQLLIGDISFSNMSTTMRKVWLTEILSDTNFEFGLNLYNKTRERIKTINSVIKMFESKLLNKSKELEEMKNVNLAEIERNISVLEDSKRKILTDIKTNIKTYDREMLLNKLEEYLKLYERYSNVKYVDNLESRIENLISEIEHLEGKKKTIHDSLTMVNELLDNIKMVTELENKKLKLEKELIEFNEKYVEDLELSMDDILYLLDNITDDLYILNNFFGELKTLDIDTKDLPKLEEDLINTQKNKESLTSKLIKIETELEHMNKAKENKVVCDKCGNVIIPGFSRDRYKQLEEEHDRLINHLKKLDDTINTLNNKIETIKRKRDIINNIKSFVTEHNIYLKLFKKWLNGKTFEEGYRDIELRLTELNNFINTYNNEILKYFSLKKLKDKLSNIKDLKLNNKENLLERYKKLSEDYNKIVDEFNNRKKELKHLKSIEKANRDKILYLTKLEKGLKVLGKNRINEYQELKNEFLKKLLRVVEDLLKQETIKLSDIKTIENEVINIKNDILELNNRLKVLKLLEKALSPKTGILAKGLLNYINNFIDELNKVIDSIFDYDLKIKHIDLDEDKLDFNFKLMVKKVNIIPDISKGSSGMKEVIDLAFRLVAMKMLNLTNYPLILDEFGRTMDPIHRKKAYDYISDIATDFSNVFITSHNDDVITRFPNAELVILDREHYNLPNVKNTALVKG